MIYKIIGAIVIATAAVIGFLVVRDIPSDGSNENCHQQTPAEQFTSMIDQDFKRLAQEKSLPVAWAQITSVEFRMNSTLAQALLGHRRPHFPMTPNGKYLLAVDVLDMPDEENPGIILQCSLIDLKTKNKIYEIGRTYTMNELNKVPAENPQPVQQKHPATPPQQKPAPPTSPQTQKR